MDITEVKRRLADRALQVAEHLLPNGRKDGHEWRVGSVGGEAGKSLGVHLGGAKAGVWQDFASGEGGDLIDLWRIVRGVDLPTALDEARSWLGIERPEFLRPAPKTYRRPPKPACRKPRGKVRDYLIENRNLPETVLEAYRVGEDGGDIVFPFLLPDGTLALAKRRAAEDDVSPMPTARDCEPVLFGWQAVPADAREIVITEGEIDALSMAAYGWPALSVPFGGGGGAKQTNWIEAEFDRLDRFERIYLALDMDEPGETAARLIAERLGRHRCYRVTLPHKDANDCLVAGVPADEIGRCLAGAATYDPEGLRLPSQYGEAVIGLFWPQEGMCVGYRTPYGKLGDKLLFRPSEVTVWSGASGDGKSQILSDCAVGWVAQGSRICLSSLEMPPAQTLKRMVKQALGVDRPTEAAIRDALAWLDAGLILYGVTGKVKVEALLEVFDYARAKYGCDQFVIDSLMRLGSAGDDYNGQEGAMFRLVDWAMARGVHVHLVAHSRKGDRDRGAPNTEDVKGAMEVGANAANIVTIWRNRRAEETAGAPAIAVVDEETGEVTDAGDKSTVVLNVAKQRNGDFEGRIGLWFNQETYQYTSSHDERRWPRNYVRNREASEAA